VRLLKILIVIFVISIIFWGFKELGEEPESKFQTVLEMPDGERIIAEVHYGKNWTELTVKLQDGRVIASEKANGKLSEEEIKERAKKLI
jgi:hypothetical protein